jgi:hypothetical protein
MLLRTRARSNPSPPLFACAQDFVNRALRYDVTYISGPLQPFTTLMNFTSLWLNDTLYMITWEAYLDKTPNCVALSMGFGLMKPDWFSHGDQYGIFWPAKKTDGADPAYHATLATVTDAGQGVDLPFTYYSLSENITDTDGTPFLMHAPSPYGMVVNECQFGAPLRSPARARNRSPQGRTL